MKNIFLIIHNCEKLIPLTSRFLLPADLFTQASHRAAIYRCYQIRNGSDYLFVT